MAKVKSVLKLYNKEGQLLFVTKSPNLVPLASQDWFKDTANITIEHFHSSDDADEYRAVAIWNEEPKWNSNKPTLA